MGGGMEAHKNKFIEDWSTARENLEYNFRWTRRNLALVGIFGIAVPILIYKGIVREFVRPYPTSLSLSLCGSIAIALDLTCFYTFLRLIGFGGLRSVCMRSYIYAGARSLVSFLTRSLHC